MDSVCTENTFSRSTGQGTLKAVHRALCRILAQIGRFYYLQIAAKLPSCRLMCAFDSNHFSNLTCLLIHRLAGPLRDLKEIFSFFFDISKFETQTWRAITIAYETLKNKWVKSEWTRMWTVWTEQNRRSPADTIMQLVEQLKPRRGH